MQNSINPTTLSDTSRGGTAASLLAEATKAANDFAASLNAATEIVPWKPAVLGDPELWCDTWEVSDQASAERAGRIWAKLTIAAWGDRDEDMEDPNYEYKSALYSAYCARL